jgi:hypothetical protein
MHDELIYQKIPGGALAPNEQVALVMELVRNAAQLLTIPGSVELENALAAMHEPLQLYAAAGVLEGVSLYYEDSQGLCGVKAIVDPWGISDFEEVDLSSLRLLATSEAPAVIEIALLDSAFAEEISGTQWLPAPSESLECRLVTASDTTDDMEQQEEDGDGYDDEDGSEYDGEIGELSEQFPPPPRLSD